VRYGERDVPLRLQKFLARAGVASRRGSEDLMTAGRVAVNGVVVTELGAKVDPGHDEVTVDGVRVRPSAGPVYLALNKPAGYVTTMSDPQGRPTVAQLMPIDESPGLFPVGRLDAETTGLLLFTTDGELSHRILHPRWKVPKTYTAAVDGVPDAADLRALRTGIALDDGITAPAQVKLLTRTRDSAEVEITITEGRKRQVRRMFSAVSHPVRVLRRLSFGPVELGHLREGTWRHLSAEEVGALQRAAGIDPGAESYRRERSTKGER
jgi:23S rRNA pseudouridine2605 synthase